MTILLDEFIIPEQGTFELKINRAIEITFSAEQARRKVNIWLVTEVANMLAARTPTLVVGEKVVWRVPIVLTTSHLGAVGVVGEVDVDVQTGIMDTKVENIQKLLQSSTELGKTLPVYKARTEVPEQFVARNYRPTHPPAKPNPAFVQSVIAAFASEKNS